MGIATKSQNPEAFGPVATTGAQASPLLVKRFSKALPQSSAAKVVGNDGNDVVIPKGARVVAVQSLGGGTGGSSPNVDLGDGSDPNFFKTDLDADTAGVLVAADATAAGVALTADKTLYIIDGTTGTAATGGTFVGYIYYTYDAADLPDLSGT